MLDIKVKGICFDPLNLRPKAEVFRERTYIVFFLVKSHFLFCGNKISLNQKSEPVTSNLVHLPNTKR